MLNDEEKMMTRMAMSRIGYEITNTNPETVQNRHPYELTILRNRTILF